MRGLFWRVQVCIPMNMRAYCLMHALLNACLFCLLPLDPGVLSLSLSLSGVGPRPAPRERGWARRGVGEAPGLRGADAHRRPAPRSNNRPHQRGAGSHHRCRHCCCCLCNHCRRSRRKWNRIKVACCCFSCCLRNDSSCSSSHGTLAEKEQRVMCIARQVYFFVGTLRFVGCTEIYMWVF